LILTLVLLFKDFNLSFKDLQLSPVNHSILPSLAWIFHTSGSIFTHVS